MKKKRHTTEEIIRILRKADEGQTVEEVCREVNIRGADLLPVEEEVWADGNGGCQALQGT